jgi:hypothetical protein
MAYVAVLTLELRDQQHEEVCVHVSTQPATTGIYACAMSGLSGNTPPTRAPSLYFDDQNSNYMCTALRAKLSTYMYCDSLSQCAVGARVGVCSCKRASCISFTSVAGLFCLGMACHTVALWAA